MRRLPRVLIVDDNAFMRTALSCMIESSDEFEIAGSACDGSEALNKIACLNPDVVTLDLEMAGLRGLDILRRIMLQFPRPVIVVNAISEKSADATFSALALGAFDYVPKHLSSTSLDIVHIRQDLILKLRAAALSRGRVGVGNLRKPPRLDHLFYEQSERSSIVAIGASTGGPRALQQILPMLPGDLGVPVLIVQHMPPGFTAAFADHLNSVCALNVREAVHGEPLVPGVVYISPAGVHMTVQSVSQSKILISLDRKPYNTVHIPSVDVMMKSVARVFDNRALGIILTGMGFDGKQGIRAIHLHGGITVGQDEASCVVYGMPRACAELGVLSRIVPLSEIPTEILDAIHYKAGFPKVRKQS